MTPGDDGGSPRPRATFRRAVPTAADAAVGPRRGSGTAASATTGRTKTGGVAAAANAGCTIVAGIVARSGGSGPPTTTTDKAAATAATPPRTSSGVADAADSCGSRAAQPAADASGRLRRSTAGAPAPTSSRNLRRSPWSRSWRVLGAARSAAASSFPVSPSMAPSTKISRSRGSRPRRNPSRAAEVSSRRSDSARTDLRPSASCLRWRRRSSRRALLLTLRAIP